MSKLKNLNAVKHGVFSVAVLLPGEDPDEFTELRKQVYAEWNPEGITETDKADSIVLGLWRKRRFRSLIIRDLQVAVDQDNFFKSVDKGRYNDLVDILEDVTKNGITADELAKKLPPFCKAITEKHPREKYKGDAEWRSAVAEEIREALNRMISRGVQERKLDDYLASEPLIDRELCIEERIDAKISKDVKDLCQMKAMKEMCVSRVRDVTGLAVTKQRPTDLVAIEQK
jgi:hypothetical protein